MPVPLAFADDLTSPVDQKNEADTRTSSKPIFIDNGRIRIGLDPNKGGAIFWLSSDQQPDNIVNHSDAGRLVQQSYYAGEILDRKQDGQHKSWSPWAWNPVQGGGVGCWAEATRCEKTDQGLYSETTPKLWDMHNQDAQAVMKQWVSFEPTVKNSVVIRCRLESLRDKGDRWSSDHVRHQEVPACYFIRSLSRIESYLGRKEWQQLKLRPGPPWHKVEPKHNAMAMFGDSGSGVALFSPTATEHWNVGPHAARQDDSPTSKSCMHMAPISRARLLERSVYEYRYWLILGDRASIEASLDKLIADFSDERAKLTPLVRGD